MAMRQWWERVLCAEAGGEGDGGAGGGAPAAGTDQGAGGSEPGKGGEKQTPVDIAAGMLAAIESGVAHEGSGDDGLSKADDKGGQAGSQPGQQGSGQPLAPSAAGPAAGAKPDAGVAPGSGKAPAPAQGQQAQAGGKTKADDFALTDEDKRALKPASQQRFHELHKLAKTHEATIETLTAENAGLSQARDNIMNVLTENKVEPDDFVALMDFNRKVKTGDLEGALTMCDDYRTQLLKALGRDAPGYDPLSEPAHVDLKARVDKLELSREDALQLVNARRVQTSVEQGQQRQQETQQQQRAAQKEQDDALAAVKAWNARIAADVDYEGKAGTILPQLEGIIRDYPPHLWVPTLDRLWKSTAAPQQQAQQQGQQQGGTTPAPLRPSGAKGGAPAPKNMLEALEQGLGYQGR